MHRSLVLALTLASAARLASPAIAFEGADLVKSPVIRHGAGFQEDYLLGNVRGPTLDLMLKNRWVTWRKIEPFSRVRTSIEVLRNHKDPATRAAAIDDLLFHPSDRVEDALREALRDPTLAVRTRAVRALGEIGTAPSVRPLIEAMDVSPGPIRDEIAHSLWKLTGKDYGRHQDRWLRWFEANRDLLR